MSSDAYGGRILHVIPDEDVRLAELAGEIMRDKGAPPHALIAAAWLTLHGDSRPLRALVEEASSA